MEWIETTGETVAEAEEYALKMLGIERDEAEFVVVTEPKSGILRLKKRTARIRARIKPRPAAGKTKARNRSTQKRKNQKNKNTSRKTNSESRAKETGAGSHPRKNSRSGQKTNRKMKDGDDYIRKPLMAKEKQEELLTEFFEGILEAWQLSAEIVFEWPKEHICEVSLKGEGLDDLIGNNATTLHSLQNIVSVVLRQKAEDTRYAQIRLDVADYRAKREEALQNFVLKLAEEVKDAGTPKILEPMDNRDRKVVHDALSEIEGISTVSEGENPRRRVKIVPTETA